MYQSIYFYSSNCRSCVYESPISFSLHRSTCSGCWHSKYELTNQISPLSSTVCPNKAWGNCFILKPAIYDYKIHYYHKITIYTKLAFCKKLKPVCTQEPYEGITSYLVSATVSLPHAHYLLSIISTRSRSQTCQSLWSFKWDYKTKKWWSDRRTCFKICWHPLSTEHSKTHHSHAAVLLWLLKCCLISV